MTELKLRCLSTVTGFTEGRVYPVTSFVVNNLVGKVFVELLNNSGNKRVLTPVDKEFHNSGRLKPKFKVLIMPTLEDAD